LAQVCASVGASWDCGSPASLWSLVAVVTGVSIAMDNTAIMTAPMDGFVESEAHHKLFLQAAQPGIWLEDPPLEFAAVLQRPSGQADAGGFKMDLDVNDGYTLQVMRFEPGPVSEWNKHHGLAKYKDIRPYDRIFQVNGQRGDSRDLLQAMKSGDHIDVLIRRPIEYKVKVVYGKAGLGLDMHTNLDGSLVLKSIKQASPFDEWNKVHWQTPVQAGDRMIEVNGHRGNAEELVHFMTKDYELNLVFAH